MSETNKNNSKSKKTVKIAAIAVAAATVLTVGGILAAKLIPPLTDYKAAKKLLNEGKHTEAYYALTELGDYKDCKALLESFTFHYKEINTSAYQDGKEAGKYVYKYDDKGNLILDESYDKDGNLMWKLLYEYDGNGNETLSETLDKDGNRIDKIVHTYDGEGRITLKETYEGDMLAEKLGYEYTDNGYTELVYDTDGKLAVKYVFVYGKKDSETKLLTVTEHYTDGKCTEKTVQKYNDNDKEILKETHLEDGTVVKNSVYDYDDKGNQILYQTFADGVETKTLSVYEYNAEGKKTLRKDLDKDGNLIKTVKYEYEADGNVYESHFGKDGVLYEKTGYNRNGNEILKESYSKNGTVNAKTVFEYNGDGIRTYFSYQCFENGQWMLKSLEEVEYNGSGNLVMKINDDGVNYSKHCFKYNEHGKPTEEISYNREGKALEKVMREYDEYGFVTHVKQEDENGKVIFESRYENKGFFAVYSPKTTA